MSDFLISARKYRPTEFSDVVDQESVTEVLNSAISNGKLSQALLFTGPRGVGKTSCARIVARKINNFEINDDPDKNGVELYWDRSQNMWPKDENKNLTMYIKPLDLRSLLDEIEKK